VGRSEKIRELTPCQEKPVERNRGAVTSSSL
jgi:hypothetical protein